MSSDHAGEAEESLPDDVVQSEASDRRALTRMCALTREVRPITQMIRFVSGPDGGLVPDLRNRLPGRGVWVRAHSRAISEACKRNIFARALKVPLQMPPDLPGMISRLLVKDALPLLSLANKAGALVTGFAKIEGMRPPVLALVQASDGSGAEIARLRGLMAGKGPRRKNPAFVDVFCADDLGLSIGREHVIHAALMVHDVCALFLERTQRYVDFEQNLEFQTDSPAKPDNASTNGPAGAMDVPRA